MGCSTQFGSSSVPQFGSHLFHTVGFMFVKVHRVVSTGWDVPHSLVHRVFHSWFTGTDTVTGTGACLGDRSGAVLLFIPRGCWDMCVFRDCI